MNAHRTKTAILGGAVLFATACGGDVEEARAPRPVRQHVVGYAGGNVVRTFSGTAQTGRIVNLSFRSGGVITQFDLRLGQAIRPGQLLARLDDVTARLAYEQAVSSANGTASQMNTAKLTLDRTSALYEVGSASLSEFESAKNSFRTAAASHESAQRSVAIQEDQIGYGLIYAPEAGTIAGVTAVINENVSAGQTVAVLNAGSGMEIALGLPESVINGVAPGMDVDVSFSAFSDVAFTGRVTEVSPSVDATAAYPVRVTIDNPSERIRTGMAASVTFDFRTRSSRDSTLVVPHNAVGEDGRGRFVFLIEGDGGVTALVRRQQVTVGALTADGFVILEGLTAGQTIATAGLHTLLDGQRVSVQ